GKNRRSYSMMRSGLSIVFMAAIAGLGGCRHAQKEPEPQALPKSAVSAATSEEGMLTIPPLSDLPAKYAKSIKINLLPQKARLPALMVNMAMVNRSRADLRQGPGLWFDLHDHILREGAEVMVFERHGV